MYRWCHILLLMADAAQFISQFRELPYERLLQFSLCIHIYIYIYYFFFFDFNLFD